MDESRIPYVVFTLSAWLLCFIYLGWKWCLLRCQTHGYRIKLWYFRDCPHLCQQKFIWWHKFSYKCAHTHTHTHTPTFYLFLLLLFLAHSSFALKQFSHPLHFLYTIHTFIPFPRFSCIHFQSFLFGRPVVICLPILSYLSFTLKQFR
jgi:hypothetical protein